jgi:excinuclease ABC subunit B
MSLPEGIKNSRNSLRNQQLWFKGAFNLASPFEPCGDQPSAIKTLTSNLAKGERFNLLHGVTGTGKTYTIANVIAKLGRPTLVIAPNKTLAAQLYHEFKEFFPSNRVRYFVSYYDYYQPEAYIPSTDTFIEKDSAINEEIDKMRHSATKSLLEVRDSIIVASVSCIYGLGAPEEYFNLMLFIEQGETRSREEVIRKLVELQYLRTDIEFKRGTFRVRGETIDIFPSDQDSIAYRLSFFGEEVEMLKEIDPITGLTIRNVASCTVYPLSHFLTARPAIERAIGSIQKELVVRVKELERSGNLVEAQRLEQRTLYDLELMDEMGFCPGIENYSRHLAGRNEGEPPTTLIDYFPEDFLLVIDESHVTIPQIGGMFRGDRARKQNLVNYGFRLPSALDNRPLSGEEFWQRVGQTVFVTATPGEFEQQICPQSCIVQQINRPTGILDPPVQVRPATNQVDDLLGEIRLTVADGYRVLVTTLTKKMSENLSQYLREVGIKCRYLHSDINTVERVEILRGLRKGEFDVLIGINLLREGLDLVEVALVAILDADKEGFLRSTRSIIQTMGRAARNANGRVVLYGDKITDSMQRAIAETERRRKIQDEFNRLNNIIPRSALRDIESSLVTYEDKAEDPIPDLLESYKDILTDPKKLKTSIESLRAQMFDAATKREYEQAANFRDTIQALQKFILES